MNLEQFKGQRRRRIKRILVLEKYKLEITPWAYRFNGVLNSDHSRREETKIFPNGNRRKVESSGGRAGQTQGLTRELGHGHVMASGLGHAQRGGGGVHPRCRCSHREWRSKSNLTRRPSVQGLGTGVWEDSSTWISWELPAARQARGEKAGLLGQEVYLVGHRERMLRKGRFKDRISNLREQG